MSNQKSKKKPTQPLTPKQEAFAVTYLLNGGDATAAYKEVYNVKEDAKIEGLYVDAHKVLRNPKVALRVHQLQMDSYSPHILSLDEAKRMLTNKAKVALNTDGLKALDMLNKMCGHYEADNKQSKPEAILKITRNYIE